MTSRRNFLKRSGAAALGTIFYKDILKGAISNVPANLPATGIQTFTLNAMMNADPEGTLKQLANIGFRNIEIASYSKGSFYGHKPGELKKIIDDLGMKWIGCHVMGLPFSQMMPEPENPTPEQKKQLEMIKKMISPDLLNLTQNAQELVDLVAEGGVKYLVCAGTAIKTMDQIKSAVDTFSRAGELCHKAGLQFAYHNHATEWDKVDGTTAYDFILRHTDKDLVKMELDLGWVSTAKKDPIELFRGNPGRFPLWHLKDFDLSTNTIVPVGQGNVDFKRIFENAGLAGMKYYFYEQDGAKSMDEVKESYNNIEKIVDSL